MAQISIIVPIYNAARYVRQALGSLTMQTLRDIEIICVDDCGTDNSMSIVDEFAARDARIKIIHNPHNMDIADTRNAGLAAATAPYVMWCDADDWYKTDMCEKMLRAICDNKSDIAICGTNVIYEADEFTRESDTHYFAIKNNCTLITSSAIVNDTNVCLWNKIFRRDIIDDHNIRFPSGLRYEDEFFFRAYMCYAQKITFITDKLYNYRRNCGSIMNKTFNKTAKYTMDALRVGIEYQKFLAAHNLYDCKYDEFWGDVFPAFLRLTIMRAGRRSDVRRTFDIATDFINQQYIRPASDPRARRVVGMIRDHKYMPIYRRILGGIWRYINYDSRRELLIGPVSIYKIKHTTESDTIYVLGIPVFKQKAHI